MQIKTSHVSYEKVCKAGIDLSRLTSFSSNNANVSFIIFRAIIGLLCGVVNLMIFCTIFKFYEFFMDSKINKLFTALHVGYI